MLGTTSSIAATIIGQIAAGSANIAVRGAVGIGLGTGNAIMDIINAMTEAPAGVMVG